jgi:hypothetical protein
MLGEHLPDKGNDPGAVELDGAKPGAGGERAARGVYEVEAAEVVIAGHGSDCFRRATIPHLRAVRELFIDALSPQQLAAADDIASTLRRHLDRSGPTARKA